MVGGSKSVRGRKNLKKAMNQAPRNPVTVTHTSRRRLLLISLGSGPTVAKPPAAAALDVPTAGVPTYLVASPPPAAVVFAASGFGLADSDSGPAMRYLLDSWSSKSIGGPRKRRPCPLGYGPAGRGVATAENGLLPNYGWLQIKVRIAREKGSQIAQEREKFVGGTGN